MLSCPKKEISLGIAAALANIIARLNQHAARTAGRVVDTHPWLRVDDFDERADDLGRRVELPGLFARGIGKELDQVFVGGAEQVGELEVLVTQRNLLEILDEVRQRVVVERALADLTVEVDMLEHVLKRIYIGGWSSIASSALLRLVPTLVFRWRIFDQWASSGTKKVYWSGFVT